MAYLYLPPQIKIWQLCWTVKKDGKTVWKRKSTGTADREEAEKILKMFQDAQAKRLRRDTISSLLAEAGNDIAQEVPLAQLWDWYMQHCEASGNASQQRDRHNALDRFIAWLATAHPEIERTNEVTLRIASEYWTFLAAKGAAPSTRNNNLSALNTIWSNVQAPMELPTNPWSAIKRDTGGSVSYQPFSQEEMAALRKAASEYHTDIAEVDFWQTAIEMGYYTGLRLGDIATLDYTELEQDEDFLILTPNKTRHWGGDRVAVHSLELPWVKMLPALKGKGHVWPRAAEAYANGALSRDFTALATNAGIKLDREPEEGERRTRNVRLKCFHSLRHTYATEMLKAGMTESELRDQGNWSGTEVIHGHYNHAKLQLAKQAAAKVAQLNMDKSNL